jgi:excisionase family DNA binding protein
MEDREDYKTIWTTQQLADKAGLTVSYIRRLLRKGIIKGEQPGRDWLIADSEARRFLSKMESDRQ